MLRPAILSAFAAFSTFSALIALMVLVACGRSFENPSDPGAERFSRRSEAYLERLGEREPVEGDTVRLVGGVTSPEVEADGLVVAYAWDLDGDGIADTVLARTDTLEMPVREPGRRTVSLSLSDAAGFRSEASASFPVHPALPRLFAEGKDYASDCPVYAQEPALMRLVLALSHFATERSREEGFGTADFALKLAQALTGSAFPVGLLEGFDYSFRRGVYRFRNPTFELEVAFHYGSSGSSAAGHAEGDTILANLFDLDSYVRDIRVAGFPPELLYSQGPLASLVDGDIEVDGDNPEHPEFDFRVDFGRILVSFRRETRTYLALSNQEMTHAGALLFTFYEGRARIAPLYPPDILRLYGRDSLELDFSGSRVASRDLSIPWPYETANGPDTGIYRISLEQETLAQSFRFGDKDGLRKVFGDYAAVNRLRAGEGGAPDGALEAVHFRGVYSSLAADSARFFCREPEEGAEPYGEAAFETAAEGRGSFAAKRFGYVFTFPYSTVEPWEGPAEARK